MEETLKKGRKMTKNALEHMDEAGLRQYLEFLLWHYRVVDGFWFIYVTERFDLQRRLDHGLIARLRRARDVAELLEEHERCVGDEVGDEVAWIAGQRPTLDRAQHPSDQSRTQPGGRLAGGRR